MMKRKFKTIALSLIGVALVIMLIDVFIIPMKKIELLGLHSMYLKGSGYDDGVVSIIAENPQRYSDQIIDILKYMKPGSDDEDMVLAFVELVIDQPRVREALADFGESHPIADTKCLVQIILSDEPTMEPVADASGNVIAYRAIASRFECKES